LARFAPSLTPNNDKIDYSIWDEAMKAIVVSMGPSLREGAPRPEPSFGTRRQYGHVSRYRLEGTRVTFSFLDSKVIASFTEYREDLENTASVVDIQALSRNEQLAFWINLHNVAMVEQIAKAWPLRQPRELKVGGVPLDEARFITIEGVKLSPRDIREQIVYRYWKDPVVIYGFWRGEIGGPALQPAAFTGQNVGSLLDLSANEFVNALRGTEKRGKTLHVSRLYAEVAPFYFPDFTSDLRAHLESYAEDEVSAILAETTGAEASISEPVIADLAGGSRGSNTLAGSVSASRPGIPPGAVELIRQRQYKLEVMRRRKEATGRVFFSNIDLPGDPFNKYAVE
jgi:hypothetical protein